MDFKETCITRIHDDDHVGVYTSERRFITAIYRLKEKHPDKVIITNVNPDGSVCANMPYDWLKLPGPKRAVSDKTRQLASERLSRMHRENRGGFDSET